MISKEDMTRGERLWFEDAKEISEDDRAYYRGICAMNRLHSRETNPYEKDSQRAAWFVGWDEAFEQWG